MNDRFDEIMQYAAALGIHVSEEDLEADLDAIADTVSDTFWDEVFHKGEYDQAYDTANDTLGELLENLPYISEHLVEDDWDESDDYDSFRELVMDEVFERADIPADENELNERVAEDRDLEDNEFEEDENS
jgi:hypothetical protein